MDKFKIIIKPVKPVKPKVKETDPIILEQLREKRKLQREARKNKPKQEPKPKVDYSKEIENINKTMKNIVGFSIDEINEKLEKAKITTVQIGLPKNN